MRMCTHPEEHIRAEGAIDRGEYILDNAWQLARRRLARLEEQLDPGTIRHLQALGVGAGWRCLEVGGGGGSVADWLCRRVGPGGSVLATDVDTRFLTAVRAPNLDVRRHDIVAEELPAAAFDLVHARTVLNHLGRRDLALRRMAAAVRPGPGCWSRKATGFPGSRTPLRTPRPRRSSAGTGRPTTASPRPAGWITPTVAGCTGMCAAWAWSTSARRGACPWCAGARRRRSCGG